ncbi:reticulon-like protein B21 isoform X2 [Phalaenopsis equestris]|uniref:reticulon-like protein B21 isoform X2 n=1 Tax=Phalaenopsis equestris TaxID=78828 RepID=UPI0009E4D181|nr:reticulon-like protein B21 isoform X2 [Phalaenopsis equestris]
MQPATRRRAIIRNGVMAGSVWETRMKMDEVQGGIKVFNAAGESRDDEEGLRVYRRLRRNQSGGLDLEKKKRKNWKQPEAQRSPIQLRKAESIEIGSKRGVGDKGVLLICDGQGNEKEMEEGEEDEKIEMEVEERRRSFDDKEMDLPVEKEMKEEEMKKIEEVHEIQVSAPPMVVDAKKASFVEDFRGKDPDPVEHSQEEEEVEEEILFETISGNSNRMQHIVDLVMWKDISKTAFTFGFGTFILVSSSYAKDLNFSLISVISYLGLLYLAAIFFLRSIFRRGEEEVEFLDGDGSCLVGEEEAVWILRRILPYINEILLRTRALFSGDPATTMKMAVFLFVMGRCGSSITLWTLAKLAFFGVFTVPKVLSSYSLQLGRYGKFWLERFRDGWETCTHKKLIVSAIFTLIWNLSSTIARIWAAFMLVVAIRLYRQQAAWDEEDIPIEQNSHHQQHNHQQQQQQQQQRRRQNIRRDLSLINSRKIRDSATREA